MTTDYQVISGTKKTGNVMKAGFQWVTDAQEHANIISEQEWLPDGQDEPVYSVWTMGRRVSIHKAGQVVPKADNTPAPRTR